MANAGFSKELDAFIDEWKTKPGNLIMILHKVQEEQGYISKEAAAEVAKRTNSHLARVYGVMSFYHFFKTQRPGKNMISVCLGTACYLKGGQDIIDEAKSILGLADDKISTDDGETVENFRRQITSKTKAVFVTHASNVNGKILPVKDIFSVAAILTG